MALPFFMNSRVEPSLFDMAPIQCAKSVCGGLNRSSQKDATEQGHERKRNQKALSDLAAFFTGPRCCAQFEKEPDPRGGV